MTDGRENYLIKVNGSLPDPPAWDDVIRASGAPVFYLSDVLRAYQAYPLQPALGVHYVTARSAGSGKLAAVLPAYLTPAADPLGIMPTLVPGYRPDGRPLLLSHFWHWYDTHLPARRLTSGLIIAMVGALRNLAASAGAQAFGLVNVPADASWAENLGGCGLTGRLIDARYTLDLRSYGSADDYVGALPRGPRQEYRRHLRKALAAEAKIAVEDATPGTLAAVARLCRHSAAKHGNPDWYQPEQLSAFLSAAGRHVLLITVRMNGDLVAASVSFADGPRFHNWAAGSVSPRVLPFSPYLMLLYGSVDAALMGRCQLIEGGRRNDSWKKRLGMRRQPLGGWAAAV